MPNTQLDAKFQDVVSKRPKMLIRLLSLVKKDIDARLTEIIQNSGYKEFKIGDMVLLANISPEGTINNELAKKAKITKQAMSKVVKNLTATGFIDTRKHETDNRATVIYLTDKGKQLIIECYAALEKISTVYTGIIGEKDTEILRDILFKLASELHPEYFAK